MSLNKFWLEFIDLYKSLPELWRIGSEEYSNKTLRKKAYDIMLEKYNEVDKNANIYTVKKKINNIRTAFRRELNKMRRSEQTALTPDDIYSPTLWYFKNLDFLMEHEEEDTADGADTTIGAMEEVTMVDDEVQTQPERTPARKRKVVTQQIEDEPERQPQPPQFQIKKDKSGALSGAWEFLYRDLEARQQLYANRIINEVLYQAALGKLQEKSYKVLETIIIDEQQQNGEVGHYNSERVTETQYYLEESSEDIDEEMLKEQEIKKENQRKRQRIYK